MFALLAAGVVFQSNQLNGLRESDEWVKTFGEMKPTGQNGLEEAAAAVYLARQMNARILFYEWSDDRKNLEAEKAVSDITVQLLPLIEASSSKPWHLDADRKMDSWKTTSGVSDVIRTFIPHTRRLFRNGDSKLAAERLLLALRFSRKVGEVRMGIAAMRSHAQTVQLMVIYDDSLHRFPEESLVELVDELDRQLAVNLMIWGLEGDANLPLSGPVDLEDKRARYRKGYKDNPQALAIALALTQEDYAAVERQSRAGAAEALAVMKQHPPHLWEQNLAEAGKPVPGFTPGARWLNEPGPDFPMGMARSSALQRIPLGILRVSALIRLHELQTGQLPESLNDIDRKDAIFDPFSNAPYSYTQSHGRFDVISRKTIYGDTLGITRDMSRRFGARKRGG
jgi:hypothetical protein